APSKYSRHDSPAAAPVAVPPPGYNCDTPPDNAPPCCERQAPPPSRANTDTRQIPTRRKHRAKAATRPTTPPPSPSAQIRQHHNPRKNRTPPSPAHAHSRTHRSRSYSTPSPGPSASAAATPRAAPAYNASPPRSSEKTSHPAKNSNLQGQNYAPASPAPS